MGWNHYFQYRCGKLYWKINKGRSKVGDEAGYIHKSHGYICITLNRKEYYAHRIIWEMHYGPIPEGMEIDHIWHDRQDNRIENLRLVSKLGNARNQSKFKNNSSGVTGVSFDKSVGKWIVQIGVNGINKTLGCFEEFNKAVEIRRKAEIKYGYHVNHGK